MNASILATVLLLTAASGAASPTLIADLEPGERVSSGFAVEVPPGVVTTPSDLDLLISRPAAALGDGFVFVGRSAAAGLELWRSDGSEEGTTLVRDLCPGPCDADPRDLVAAGELVYFSAARDRLSPERTLFRSDGTRGGTLEVYGGCPGGRCFEAPQPLVAVDEALVFSAAGDDGALALWRTDGSREGTRPLAAPGCPAASVARAAASDGRAYLGVRCRDGGEAIWAVDEEGAVELQRGAGFRSLTPLADGGLGYVRSLADPLPPFVTGEFWITDGTPAGTRAVASPSSCGQPSAILASPAPGRLLASTSELSFPALIEFDCLWLLEPGKAPIALFGDGLAPQRIFDLGPQEMPAFFVVTTPDPSPQAGPYDRRWFLAVSDGTPAGTRAEVELAPFPSDFARLGDRVLFDDRGVHASDGTPAGTERLTDFEIGGVTRVGDRVLFGGLDGLGFQPWTSDGTAGGTRRLAALGVGPASSEPASPLALGERLIFAAGSDHGSALWATDGAAVERLSDLAGRPSSELAAGGVFFDGSRALFGSCGFPLGPVPSLVSTDGTVLGTEPLSAEGLCPHAFARFGDATFFAAFDQRGTELWRTDGTAAGTGFFTEIAPGDDPWGDPPDFKNGDPADLLELRGGLVFAAWSPDAGRELWRSDGTAAGTRRFVDLCAGACDGSPAGLTPVPDRPRRVLFAATTPDGGRELWRTEGNADSTVLLAELLPGPAGSSPHGFVGFQGNVYFFARDEAGGESLWRSDGGRRRTKRVARLRLQGESGRVPAFSPPIVAGDRLFFAVDHPATGLELWTSDGTRAGTRLVRDVDPGPSSSHPGELTAVDGVLVFAAATAGRGRELWTSDGTREGTRRLTDLAPGPASSSPAAIAALGDRVVFRADDGSTGGELWSISRAALPAASLTQPDLEVP